MYQSSDSEICLNWEGVVDTHSGIVSLKWGIGTSPGTYDVLPLQNVTDEESAAHVVCATSLGLSHGVSYYSTLIATNGADLETTISSNGGIYMYIQYNEVYFTVTIFVLQLL